MTKLPEYMRDLVRNVGDDVVRDLVNDFRRPPVRPTLPTAIPVDAAPVVTANEGPSHRGWVEPRPLAPAPGLDWAAKQEALARRIAERAKAAEDEE